MEELQQENLTRDIIRRVVITMSDSTEDARDSLLSVREGGLSTRSSASDDANKRASDSDEVNKSPNSTVIDQSTPFKSAAPNYQGTRKTIENEDAIRDEDVMNEPVQEHECIAQQTEQHEPGPQKSISSLQQPESRKLDSQPEPQPDPWLQPQPQSQPPPQPHPRDTESEPEQLQIQEESQHEQQSQLGQQPHPEQQLEQQPQPGSQSQPQPQPEPERQPLSESQSQSRPIQQPHAQSEPQLEPQSEQIQLYLQLQPQPSEQPEQKNVRVRSVRRHLTTNPFSSGEDDDDGSPKASTNPFADDSDGEPLEAFVEGKIDDEESGGEGDDTWRERSPVRTRFNPFDDGEMDEDVDVESTMSRRRLVTESLAPFTLASMVSSRTAESFRSSGSVEVPAKKYAKEIHTLIELGFDRVCVTNILIKTGGDVDKARTVLINRLLGDRVMLSHYQVWSSPVIVRVGGWLPNVQDDLGTLHTAYFISVTMSLGNESWRVGNRYSEFYNFYCTLYAQICKAFPTGMKNPFPNDRLVAWLGLEETEQLSNKRRRMLDCWMRELTNSPAMLLDGESRQTVFDFLEVDAHMSRMARLRQSHAHAHAHPHPNPQNTGGGRATPDGTTRRTSFRSRSLVSDPSPPTTPTTSPWQPMIPNCCKYPVMRMGSTDQSTMEDSGPSGPTATAQADADAIGSPEMSLANRRKAALVAQQNDDNAAAGSEGPATYGNKFEKIRAQENSAARGRGTEGSAIRD